MTEAPRDPRPPESAEPAQPVEFTRGFIAFIGAMVVPAVLALAIFLGAWAVSGEVYAAEAAAEETGAAEENAEVAGWKQSLVGICPIH